MNPEMADSCLDPPVVGLARESGPTGMTTDPFRWNSEPPSNSNGAQKPGKPGFGGSSELTELSNSASASCILSVKWIMRGSLLTTVP